MSPYSAPGIIVDRINQGLTVEAIARIVCEYYNVPWNELHYPTRKREIVQARQVSMYFSKQKTHKSLSYIGKAIGNKDHATVLFAVKTVKNLWETDKVFRAQLEEIERRLKG